MSGDTDPAAAWLDGVRERADHADRVLRSGGNFGEAAARSQADVPRLLAAVEAVLKLHAPTDVFAGSGQACSECSWPSPPSPVPYPCATVRAITREPTGEESGHG
jgi:hypothetical protein